METSPRTAPPPTPVERVNELIHGVEITDPYRWLEDRDSPATRDWLQQQISYSRGYLDAISGADRNQLRKRIGELLNVPVIAEPWKAGQRCFFEKRPTDQEQAVIAMREDSQPDDIVLVNPSARGDQPAIAIGILAVSDDGKFLAYSVRRGGEDSYAVEFVDADRRQILPDRLPYGYCPGLVFSPDGSGFFYSHLTIDGIKELHRSVRLHKFGTSPEQDAEVFSIVQEKPFHLWMFSIPESQRLGYLITTLMEDPPCSDLYVHDVVQGNPARRVAEGIHGHFYPIARGGELLAMTDSGAPNYKIVAIDLERAQECHWREVIPETKNQIQCFALVGDKILVSYIEDCCSRVEIFMRNGRSRGALAGPTKGTIRLQPWPSKGDTLFYRVSSFAHPPEIWAYQAQTSKCYRWSKSQSPFDPESIEVKRVTYSSKDGTEIPMHLVFRRNAGHKFPRPTFLTGYGGFGVSVTPQFAVYAAVLMEQGLLFAICNLRGGSEFGRRWHLAAKRRNRQTAVDDFISGAEWLLANGYAERGRLAIGGGSNAGLLVGAATTQRPDLFRAVLCQGPLLDMLRYHKFDHADLWLEEYGSPEDPGDFEHLRGYSPYHRVQEGEAYPAMMLISGDADTRCNPMHARKMAARLQAATSSPHPILLDYRPNWGHTAAQPLTERIEALTDRLLFICSELGVAITQEKRSLNV